jgi:hypothetical protein
LTPVKNQIQTLKVFKKLFFVSNFFFRDEIFATIQKLVCLPTLIAFVKVRLHERFLTSEIARKGLDKIYSALLEIYLKPPH